MIDAEEMEDRGVHVVHVHLVDRGAVAVGVRFAVRVAAPCPSSGEPVGEAKRVVVAMAFPTCGILASFAGIPSTPMGMPWV